MSNYEKIIKGDDVNLNFTLFDESGVAITTLEDATSITFRMKNLEGDDVVEINQAGGLTITDNANGKISVPLTDTVTSLLDIGIHKFEVEVVDSNAKKISMRDVNGDIHRVVVTENF